MDATELNALLSSGETTTIEFKASFDREAVETCGAFANTQGGILLIGVSDSGVVHGIDLGKETLRNWGNQISQATEPRLIPDIESIDVDGATVVIITVQEFPIKPVAVRGRCLRRVDNSNRQMPPQEVSQMHLNSIGMSWDTFPARDATPDDLDQGQIRKYIQRANESGRRNIEAETPTQVLEKLELLRDGQLTWAATLLFANRPQRFLSHALIHCGRFREETLVIDDRMIEGTLIDQVEEAMEFVRKNINVQFVMTDEPQREEVWDYPLPALREAIINAVVHRDYTVPSTIEIRIYDDRLVVWSPGKLPLGITIEELLQPHSSTLRNKGIAGVFYDMGLIERWGSGIDKMRNACTLTGLPEPQFSEDQGVRVTFLQDRFTEKYLHSLDLNDRQIQAVLHVKEKGKITNTEYRERFDVTDRTALRDLAELCEKSVLQKIGQTGRNTRYILLLPNPTKAT